MQSHDKNQLDRILKNIEKIKKALRIHVLDPINEADTIQIREILVTNNLINNNSTIEGERGEFDSKLKSKESKKVIINRIFSEVKNLAEIAKDTHLKDNFNNPKKYIAPHELSKKLNAKSTYQSSPEKIIKKINAMAAKNELATMKETHKNNITRLSTNEFYFYPSPTQGPLDENSFLELIKKIEDLAKGLPENLHLVLASFPVKKANNQVDNVVIYIQCGSLPTIQLTTKASPSNEDPNFADTSFSRYFRNKKDFVKALTTALNKKTVLLVEKLKDDSSKLTIEEINNLLTLYHQYQEFKASKEIIDILQNLLSHLETHTLFPEEGIAFSDQLKNFMEKHGDDMWKQLKKIDKNESLYTPTFSLQHSPDKETLFQGASLGGQIECVTAGGKRFKTVSEICIEHKNKDGKKMQENAIELHKADASQVLATHLSHIVVSNIIEIKKKSLLTKDNTVTHTDPNFKDIRQYIKKEDRNPNLQNIKYKKAVPIERNMNRQSNFLTRKKHFGDMVNIQIYQPKKISTLQDELLLQVQANNEFALDLQALRIYRANHPSEAILVSNLIDAKIHENMLKQLESFLPESEAKLKNDLIDQLVEFGNEIEAYRSSILVFLEEKLQFLGENSANEDFAKLASILKQAHSLLKHDEIDLAELITKSTSQPNDSSSPQPNNSLSRKESFSNLFHKKSNEDNVQPIKQEKNKKSFNPRGI